MNSLKRISCAVIPYLILAAQYYLDMALNEAQATYDGNLMQYAQIAFGLFVGLCLCVLVYSSYSFDKIQCLIILLNTIIFGVQLCFPYIISTINLRYSILFLSGATTITILLVVSCFIILRHLIIRIKNKKEKDNLIDFSHK